MEHGAEGWRQCMHISSVEKEVLFAVLLEYNDVFSLHESDMGRTSLTKHKIDTGDSPPVHCPSHRIPRARKAEVRKMLHDMLDKGVILNHPSDSHWSSPIVLAKKKDGSVRFCIDFRKVNSVTWKDAYPLPRIDDTLDTLDGSKLFSTLDLKTKSKWQNRIERRRPLVHPKACTSSRYCASDYVTPQPRSNG